jgi:hypothetical protein
MVYSRGQEVLRWTGEFRMVANDFHHRRKDNAAVWLG